MDLNDEDFGFYITTFDPKTTGLSNTIHIISNPIDASCTPFMLVARSEDKIYDYLDNIKVDLQEKYDPTDDNLLLLNVHKFITLNYNLIIDHWYVKNGSFDLDRNLKPINKIKIIA